MPPCAETIGDQFLPPVTLNSSATNQLITAKDHASVQFNVGLVDENGVYTGDYKSVAFAGFQRKKGATDQVCHRIRFLVQR